jgi:hypothetical protein
METRYQIYVLSPDGLLKEPKDRWDDLLFSYAYPSFEAAQAAIEQKGGSYTDYIILTVCRKID